MDLHYNYLIFGGFMNKFDFVRQLEKKHIFWSYSTKPDLPDEIIIEHTLKFGDVIDIINLFKIFKESEISLVWLETMSNDERFEKTNFYLLMFFLKNVEKNKPFETRYERIKRAGAVN